MTGKDACWLILAAGVVVAGCNGGSGGIGNTRDGPRDVVMTTELAVRATPPIRDLPVPVGFELDEGRSRNFRGGTARYVDHLYKGGADKFAVMRFYMGQMPIQRWVLVTDMFVQGDVMMDFRKESECCRIIVSDGSLFSRTYIKITLWTTGRIQSPRGAGK